MWRFRAVKFGDIGTEGFIPAYVVKTAPVVVYVQPISPLDV